MTRKGAHIAIGLSPYWLYVPRVKMHVDDRGALGGGGGSSQNQEARRKCGSDHPFSPDGVVRIASNQGNVRNGSKADATLMSALGRFQPVVAWGWGADVSFVVR